MWKLNYIREANKGSRALSSWSAKVKLVAVVKKRRKRFWSSRRCNLRLIARSFTFIASVQHHRRPPGRGFFFFFQVFMDVLWVGVNCDRQLFYRKLWVYTMRGSIELGSTDVTTPRDDRPRRSRSPHTTFCHERFIFLCDTVRVFVKFRGLGSPFFISSLLFRDGQSSYTIAKSYNLRIF